MAQRDHKDFIIVQLHLVERADAVARLLQRIQNVEGGEKHGEATKDTAWEQDEQEALAEDFLLFQPTDLLKLLLVPSKGQVRVDAS